MKSTGVSIRERGGVHFFKKGGGGTQPTRRCPPRNELSSSYLAPFVDENDSRETRLSIQRRGGPFTCLSHIECNKSFNIITIYIVVELI